LDNLNLLRVHLGIQPTPDESGTDELYLDRPPVEEVFEPSTEDIIDNQFDEQPLSGNEVPEVAVAEVTQDNLTAKARQFSHDHQERTREEIFLQRLREHKDGHNEELRTVQYMLARLTAR